ncbi:MAG: hypothetical protein AAF907_07420 [Planctomycetota bacterium]
MGGCRLFDNPIGALFTKPVDALTPAGYDESAAADPRLSNYRPVIDQIALEVLLVERPADDPLLGQALWDSVGEVGAVDPERAERLRAAGFRVGVASADPPEAVRALLERRETIGDPLPGARLGNGIYADGMQIQRIPLRAGGDTSLPTTPLPGDLTVLTPGAGGKADRTESFDQAKGAMHIRCRAPQKGWVTFELTPEIHFGPTSLRPVPGVTGLETKQGQRIRSWPDKQFEVTLTIGDSVILGLRNDAAPDSLAAAMLAAEQDGHATDRVLVVRLADVQQIEGRRVER